MALKVPKFSLLSLIYVLVYYPNFVALSQEPLEDILQRGYISQWLICGPFNTDMPEGIKNAVKNGQPPLGKRDYWENYGGITQILPQANVEHKIDNKNYNWYPISGNSHLIDLSQSTQNFDECIFFFASYFQAKEDKTLYINLQTPLGARVWLSKVKIIDTPQKFKIENAGIDKVLVRVRKGLNLVLLQIPFISLNSLSEITNVPQSEIQTKLWLEKEPGIGKTGFEFSFRILPTLQVGKIFYISVIQPTKIFTKTGIIPHQVFYLTLYNPYPENIYPVDISAYTIPEGNSILSKEISFLPKEEKILQVEVPLPSLPTTDNKKNIRFSISAPDEMGNTKSAEFTAEILTTQPEPTSKVFLITGIYGNYSNTKSYLERKKTSIEWCKNQIIYAQDNPNYGVDLSHSSVWLELLNYYPEFLVYLKNVVSKGRSSAQNGFGLVEDWFISPETMIRNIHWGTKLKQSILKDFQNIYQLWNCLGIAPHTPNLLNSFSISGSVSNFSESLTYPICMVYPPAGNPIYIRNLAHTPNIFSLSQIEKWFYISHYPVKDLLPEIDILVLENYFPPPLPALQTDLSMYIPPYFIQGNGSSEFFQEIDDYLNNSGKISSLPTLKTCIFDTEKESKLSYEGVFSHLLTKLETSTIQTEKLSTLASLAGGDFPNKLLASLWCNLLLFSNSDFLKGNLSPQEYLISLMNLTQLCAIAEKQKVEALTKIADNTNTLAYSPIPNKEPIPIIIFNSNSNTTSAPVFINLNSLPNFPNGKLFTADGKLVPFLAHLKSPKYSSISYKTLEFVAEEVPPFGTKIYLWIPESHNPKEILTSDLFIENKYYLIKFDHSGNITEIIHKDSNDSLNLINEGIDTLGILNSDLNEFKPITEIPISIKSFKSELKQRIEIEFGAELGKVVKEYTLYHNLPYIYCSHNLSIENQNDDNIILCTRFSPDVSNNFVLTGAPLFALHRNLRTHKLVPIKGFIASGVTKFLTTKSKGTYPLSEFTVIKTNSEIDYSILRNAMWKMGIPSGELVLNVDKPSSKLANIANTLFIWAGNLKELENLKKLLDIKLSNDIYQEMGKREEIGTPFIINCGKGNSLLGFLASDNIKINLLMENFTNILTKHSEFLLPDSLTEINSPNSNENRIVVLFEGTKFAKSGKKEEMYIIHGKYQMKPLLSACISSSLSYRIVPFSKKIELTKLLKLANEEPLLGIVTTSHGGQWLPNSSFLNLSSEKVTILSIQPTGFTHPFVQEEYPNPKTFCNLRIASISEEESGVKIESVLGVKSPALMGISEKRLENQFSQNQDVNLKSWEINTIRLAFDKIRTIGNPSNTASQSIETPLVFETLQYPLTNFCPVKLGLKLNPTLSRPKVELTISNLSAFEEISGTVYLEVSREESIGPNEISYTLPPLSTAQHFLDYISSNPTETAYIRAWTDAKGFKTFAYILPEQPPCKVNIHRETNKILVDLENIMPVTVNGIILCFATQNELANHNLSYILPILPEYANFELHPHSKQQFTFALFDDIDDSKMLVYIRVCNYQEIFTVDKTLKIAGNINKHNPGN